MPLKVLIVEDNPVILDLMRQTFTTAGLEVCALQDSQSAAAILRTETFDGIFLDLEMPNVNGFQIIRFVRGSPRNRTTPIVVVTGCLDHTALKQAFDFGGTFFLHKPVDTQRLLRLFKTVHGALAYRQRRAMRIPFKTNVLCQQGAATAMGTSVNLSQGGVLLEGIQPKVGDELKLSFRSPITDAMVSADGKVVRTNERGQIAVQFTRLDNSSQHQIRKMIEQMAVA